MCNVVYLDHYSLLNIFLYAKEIKILGKGKELDSFKGREESIEVNFFAL
jgi:hypothetical protein